MSAEIVRYQPFDEITAIAKTFALTGYFDAKGTNPVEIAKAVTKILAGQEMGFGPFASINGIHIIQGRPSVSGGLIATAIKRSGRYDYRIRKNTEAEVAIEFFERAGDKWESLGVSTFTVEDARKAGTQNMAKFPRNMLFNRAISNGYRWFCPDVFEAGSVYTPDELGATVNADGEYVEATGEIVEPKDAGDVDFSQRPTLSATTVKTLHATGRDLYGKDWDVKRPQLVKHVTGGRTESSKELTDAEAVKLIDGMNARLLKMAAEADKAATEQAALIEAEPAKAVYP